MWTHLGLRLHVAVDVPCRPYRSKWLRILLILELLGVSRKWRQCQVGYLCPRSLRVRRPGNANSKACIG